LRGLICPKGKAPSSTFHDRSWIQATQYACLVVFRWLQVGIDGVVRVGKLDAAGWTYPFSFPRMRQARFGSTIQAEDMAGEFSISAICL
jgi:hypothetical protein